MILIKIQELHKQTNGKKVPRNIVNLQTNIQSPNDKNLSFILN